MNRLVLLLILIMIAVPLQTAEPTLDSLKQAYESELQKIGDVRESRIPLLSTDDGSSLHAEGRVAHA
jgi:hypothetical protein